ncbi:MAG: regulatory protein RecX [Candidatus Nanopelagicaceae bacterium]|nr:regulatory protein RecX [Candidatus Nanopelagicaceae bacterium]
MNDTSDPYSLAQTIALVALAPRAKSRGELFAHLKKRGIAEDVANAVLYRLQEQGLVNDEEFARAWVESRQRTKKLSKRVIASELRSKGVEDEIIVAVTSEIDDRLEYSIALDLALRKFRPISHLDSELIRRRIHGALARRGFSMGLINEVLREIGI